MTSTEANPRAHEPDLLRCVASSTLPIWLTPIAIHLAARPNANLVIPIAHTIAVRVYQYASHRIDSLFSCNVFWVIRSSFEIEAILERCPGLCSATKTNQLTVQPQ